MVRMLTVFVSMVAVSSITSSVLAQTEGRESYTPTREEWISVLFNSSYQIDNMATHGYRINYACPNGQNTVYIMVNHYRDADMEAMEKSKDLARQMLEAYARSKRWDGWLKIRERHTLGREGNRPAARYGTAPLVSGAGDSRPPSQTAPSIQFEPVLPEVKPDAPVVRPETPILDELLKKSRE